jgi:hypothetical protein
MNGSRMAIDSILEVEDQGGMVEEATATQAEQLRSVDKENLPVPRVLPRWVIISVFVLGMCCTFSFRIIPILSQLQPRWVRPVWYFGVLGYVIFFFHQYRISKRRRQTVQQFDLIKSLRNNEPMSAQQRQAATYVLESVTKSRERINYYVIYILSALAVAADIMLEIWN